MISLFRQHRVIIVILLSFLSTSFVSYAEVIDQSVDTLIVQMKSTAGFNPYGMFFLFQTPYNTAGDTITLAELEAYDDSQEVCADVFVEIFDKIYTMYAATLLVETPLTTATITSIDNNLLNSQVLGTMSEVIDGTNPNKVVVVEQSAEQIVATAPVSSPSTRRHLADDQPSSPPSSSPTSVSVVIEPGLTVSTYSDIPLQIFTEPEDHSGGSTIYNSPPAPTPSIVNATIVFDVVVVPVTPPTLAEVSAPVMTPTLATSSPTSAPSVSPSAAPTGTPSEHPTLRPSMSPTSSPSMSPTGRPSDVPSSSPSAMPSVSPTDGPSGRPSAMPSASPSHQPTATPTVSPSATPTFAPSATPTVSPSATPTASPTRAPTSSPTEAPTGRPTAMPSIAPVPPVPPIVITSPMTNPPIAIIAPVTSSPSSSPTDRPSSAPSSIPTNAPSSAPSGSPSMAPSSSPSRSPSNAPSRSPSNAPSRPPTKTPSRQPSRAPTKAPSRKPSRSPTKAPSRKPSRAPTSKPSRQPVRRPVPVPIKAPVPVPIKAPVPVPIKAAVPVPVKAPVRVPVKAPVPVLPPIVTTPVVQNFLTGLTPTRQSLFINTITSPALSPTNVAGIIDAIQNLSPSRTLREDNDGSDQHMPDDDTSMKQNQRRLVTCTTTLCRNNSRTYIRLIGCAKFCGYRHRDLQTSNDITFRKGTMADVLDGRGDIVAAVYYQYVKQFIPIDHPCRSKLLSMFYVIDDLHITQ